MKYLNILGQPANGTPIETAPFTIRTKAIELMGGNLEGLGSSGLILLFALFLSVTPVRGQGVIILNNIGTGANGTSVNAPVQNADGTNLLGGGFSAQFYAGFSASGPFTALGNPVPFSSILAFAGYLFGSTVAVPGFPVGSRPILIMRAWDNAGGTITSYSSATVRGQSAPFVSPALGDAITVTTIPVPQGLTSFKLRNNALPPHPGRCCLRLGDTQHPDRCRTGLPGGMVGQPVVMEHPIELHFEQRRVPTDRSGHHGYQSALLPDGGIALIETDWNATGRTGTGNPSFLPG